VTEYAFAKGLGKAPKMRMMVARGRLTHLARLARAVVIQRPQRSTCSQSQSLTSQRATTSARGASRLALSHRRRCGKPSTVLAMTSVLVPAFTVLGPADNATQDRTLMCHAVEAGVSRARLA